jgi:hypothetical protein
MQRIRRLRGAIAGFIAAMWVGVAGAEAMQFSTIPLESAPGQVVIGATGVIIPGDLDRLVTYVRALPATAQLAGFALDSPGGNIEEASKIARAFRRINATVGVLGQSRCVSACFLMFAAAARKITDPTALIGVHSASIEGADTAEAMAVTTAMARDAAALGVPSAIIGKMVVATLGQVDWLTQQDLISMGVIIAQADAPRSRPTLSASTTGVAPAVVAPPVAAEEPVTFRQGLADRQGWEQWVASLSGPYLDGATFWAGHRSDHKPPTCYGDGGADLGAFSAGCLSAQQRLSLVDVRRKADPEYRRGWNSL